MNALQHNYDIYDLGKEDTIVYSLRLSVTRCYKYDSTDMIIWSPGKPQLRTAFGYAIQNEQFQQMFKTCL